MSSTSGPSTTTSPATTPVSFPDDLASKIIWTPIINDDDDAQTPTDAPTSTVDAPTTEDTPASSTDPIPTPKFTFAESIIGEVQAHIAHGLSPAVQMGIVKTLNSHLEDKKDKRIKEPLITVLYPRDGCYEVIDAAIRATAQDQEADVLVIDSLELALGELGVFGKGAAELLSALYKEPVIPEEEESKEDGTKEESKAEEKDASESTSKELAEKDSEEKDASDSASEASSFEVVSDDKSSEEKPAPSPDATPEPSGKSIEVKEEAKDGEKDEEKKDDEKKEKKEEEKKEEEKKELTDEEKEKRKQARIEKEKARIDRELQDAFDKLVSLPPADKEPTKSRIIYWRDFGNIAHSASPILIRLFRAMHARRTAKFSKGSQSRDLLQPTILVLGDSKWITGERYSYKSPRAAFSRGGAALDKLLPFISDYEVTLSGDTTSTEVSVPSQAFFLTSLSPNNEDGDTLSESSTTTFNGKFELSEFDVSGSTMAVFPEGSDKKEFRKIEERLAGERRKTVANAWLKVALAQCGGVVSPGVDVLCGVGDDKDVDADLVKEEKKEKEKLLKKTVDYDSDDDEDAKKKKEEEKKEKEKETKDHIPKGSRILDLLVKHTSSPLPVAIERLVTAAFAIAPKPVEEGSVQVEVASFAKAYMSIIQTVKAKNAWWKKNKMPKAYYGSGSESDDEDEEKKKDEKDKKKEDPIVKKVKDAGDLTKYESRLLSCIVDIGELDTSFDDVCISESTVETLRTIVSLPLLFPSAFKFGVLAKEAIGGVLLYGPPGTGKTLVCRAVARECGARMLAIKPSDIMDCWVGESEKLVNAVFSLAYRLAPCLIFIDELDSLFRKRQNDDKKWVRDILAEFLQSMDGLRSAKKNKEAGVIVIGATNRPHDIDDAVLRRLPSRMIVDVPSEDEREKILKLHLRGETLEEGLTLTDIARKTVNYSGSDLKNLCVSAAMASVKEALGTFSWKIRKPKDEDKKDEKKDEEKKDAEKDDKDAEKKDEKKDDKEGEKKDEEKKEDEENQETEAAKERISKRTVKMSHFLQAMNEVPASSASGSHSELRRWHEQFGKKSPVSAASTASKPSYGGAGSSASTPRYTGYGSGAAGAGAGSTPRYGGYGSSESGSTPRYGASTGESSSSTSTPRYGSYGAGTSGATSTPRYGAGASAAGSTPSTTTTAGAGTTGESVASRYGSGGGFSASSYLSGLGKGSAAAGSTGGYTPGAGLARYGAGGSYKYGAAATPAVEEKPSASVEEVIEPEQVVAPEPDSEQKQKDAGDESEAKP